MLLRSISAIALAAAARRRARRPPPRPRRRARCSSARSTRRPPATGWRPRRWPGAPAARSRPTSSPGCGCATAPATGTSTSASSSCTPTGRRWRRSRRSAERRMPSGQDPEAVFAFFGGEPPQTGTGSLRLAEALSTSGRQAEAEAEIVRAWREFSMTGPERQAVLARWKAVLAPHHAARLDMLLWRGLTGEAQAMLPLVDADHAGAGAGAHRGAPRRGGAAVPDQPGAGGPEGRPRPRLRALPLPRRQAPLAGGRGLSAREVDLGRGARPARLWMERRANLARQALEDGQVEAAYEIAAQQLRQRRRRLCRLPSGWRASSR